MSSDDEELNLSGEEKSDFVPVIYARSVDDAETYRSLLEDHDIPAVVGEEAEGKEGSAARASRGIPVMVPEVLLDEASEVIADREDLESFEPVVDDVDEDEDEFGMQEPPEDSDEEPFAEGDLLDDIDVAEEDEDEPDGY